MAGPEYLYPGGAPETHPPLLMQLGGQLGEGAEAGRFWAVIASTVAQLSAAGMLSDNHPIFVLVSPIVQRSITIITTSESPARSPESFGLTELDQEALRQIAQGRSNAEIATQLYVKPHTI